MIIIIPCMHDLGSALLFFLLSFAIFLPKQSAWKKENISICLLQSQSYFLWHRVRLLSASARVYKSVCVCVCVFINANTMFTANSIQYSNLNIFFMNHFPIYCFQHIKRRSMTQSNKKDESIEFRRQVKTQDIDRYQELYQFQFAMWFVVIWNDFSHHQFHEFEK